MAPRSVQSPRPGLKHKEQEGSRGRRIPTAYAVGYYLSPAAAGGGQQKRNRCRGGDAYPQLTLWAIIWRAFGTQGHGSSRFTRATKRGPFSLTALRQGSNVSAWVEGGCLRWRRRGKNRGEGSLKHYSVGGMAIRCWVTVCCGRGRGTGCGELLRTKNNTRSRNGARHGVDGRSPRATRRG
jgi:hypothetical protein